MSLPKGWKLADEENALPEGWTLAEPESSAMGDASRRFARETGASGGQAVSGYGRLGEIVNRATLRGVGAISGLGQLPPAVEQAVLDSPAMPGTGKMLRELGQFITDANREFYNTDPARDQTLVAKLAQGAGSLPVALASGAAAPITVAAMMGEQGAEDARDSLARRGITDPEEIRRAETGAFLFNAPIGAASEALLGVPKLLKGARLMEGATALERVGRQVAATAAREGAQEGVEQLAQNVGARDVVGYDPERERTAGVGDAVLLGALIGAPLGGAVQGAQELDARARHAEFAAQLDTNKNIPESTKTLILQQDQLLQGLRPAQMFPKGSPELRLPDGMERLETERGIFHFNPRQISEAKLKSLSEQGRENEVLALGPVSKPEAEARVRAGEPAVSITERAPDGTEIKTAVGTTGTAAAQVAALEATKSPGSVVSVENPARTLTERLRAQQMEEEAKAKAVLAREQQEREQRQAQLDAQKQELDQTLATLRNWQEGGAPSLAQLKAADKTLRYAYDNLPGLDTERRQAAAAALKQIERPLAEAQLAEDAAAQVRVAAAKAQEQQREAAAKAARRAEREALDAIEATGRDPREGNTIVDITKVPDAEFEALQNNLDAEGLDLPTWEKEMERRIREQEADAGPGVPRYTLLDLFTGANGAKEWASSRLTLPTPEALRAAGDPLAGDMEAIRESLPFSYFRKDSKGDLDGLAARLRELGFREATTPAAALDMIRRAAGGEEIRPTASADFATNKETPAGWGEVDTSTPDSPRFLTETEVAKQFAALRSALGPIAQQFDVQTGLVADLLDAEGYTREAEALRAGRLGNIQAATAPRLKDRITALNAQRRFIVIGADAARKGRAPGLLLHELAHPFFDGLPADTRAVLRQMHAEETRTRTGPLYKDGKLVTPLAVEASQLPAARLRADPDLPVKEWFAERVRLLNEEWLAGRVVEADKPLLRRLWNQLLTRVRNVFAQVRRLNQRDDLFVDTFRDWLRTGNEANIAPAAASYAARQRAAFATTQSTFDLGGVAVGLDLPDAIRNLSPRWQDKTLRFESNLDKALYYAGGEGNTATRTATIEHIMRETGLSRGEVATLARDLRAKLAPLARSAAADGVLRVPPQMRPAARRLTGVDYASQAENYVDRNGTAPEKRAEAVRDITRLLETATNEQLDLFRYGANGPVSNGNGGPDNPAPKSGGTIPAQAELSRRGRAARALSAPDYAGNLENAFKDGDRISSIIPALIAEPTRGWDVRGAVIQSPRDVLTLTQALRTPYLETFKILLLNRLGEVVHAEVVSVGSLQQALADPKMFARVLARAPEVKEAYDVILSHNHPSGNPSPSDADRFVTTRFRNIVESAGHRLTDHVVTNGGSYHSFRESGELWPKGDVRVTSKRPAARGVDADQTPTEQAPWEIVPRNWLKQATPQNAAAIINAARQVSPGALHVFYLNTRNNLTALERIPDFHLLAREKLRERVYKAIGIEGAASIIVDIPDTVGAAETLRLRREFRAFAEDGNFTLVDVFGKHDGENYGSARASGLLETDDTPAAPTLAEDAKKPNLPPGVKTGADLEREQDAAKATLSDAAKRNRHPAAVGDIEDGAAWASVVKLTPDQLKEQIGKIEEYLDINALDLADIEKAILQDRLQSTKAELERRSAPAETTTTPSPLPKPDPEAALINEWRRGKALRDEGRRTGNETAEDEGQAIMTRAKARLDLRFPDWENKVAPIAKPSSPKSAKTGPRTESREDVLAQDDGRNIPPPPPDEPSDRPMPAGDPPPPNRGRAIGNWGHTAATPSWLSKRWEQVRETLVGIRGSIPELPTFPALAAQSDRFIREQGANFYDGLRAFYRALSSGNDYIQRTAEEKVAAITSPLLRLGGRFNAEDYKRYQSRLEQMRRFKADGRSMPAGAAAELAALEARLESSPYVLFNKLVYYMDLDWRGRNLKDSAGNPIRLPGGINSTEIEAELAHLGEAIAASPHAEAIERAYEQHRALVKQVADDLKARDLLAAEHLSNPVYFPHLTLEITKGDKIEQRELKPDRVRVGTEADFRGYLQDPVGSTKPIEGDYVRAMYYHLVQVGAHNFKADAIRDHVRPYDIRAQVEARAKELSKQRGVPVSWEQAFHEEYAPSGYVLYGTDSRDAFPTVQIDRDKLARRLGVVLTSEDLQRQLETLGLKGIKLLPEDLKETLVQGQRETWIVPGRVAEALRGIADRQKQTDGPIEAALRSMNSAWKAWKLFMPQNHVRYEYGNMVADLEKLFSASPRTFRFLGQSAKEMREFFNGGTPSADLRAALKDGVINAITAQEMDQLQKRKAFEQFQTIGDKAKELLFRRFTNAVSAPIANTVWTTGATISRAFGSQTPIWAGLGAMNSVELSAFREGVTRYANYLANLDAIRNGARPDYAGAYWRDIEAIRDSRPGANDRAQRQAAQISKATFGDYGDLSVTGQYLRDKLIPFYSWMEVNFKYHANLFRNLRDMVKGEQITAADAAGRAGRAAASLAVGTGARLAGGFALRLLLPYAAIALWNNTGDREELEKTLSEEDRRRVHIILGKDEDGRTLVLYGNTAFADVAKWFSGPAFIQNAGAWLTGRTDFATAFAAWRDQILPDLANNTLGSAGPIPKVATALVFKKATFPDVLDAKTIPDYDLRRAVFAQITDEFTADQIERIVSKDYAAPKDYGDWAQQLVLQVRRRDPESWAFYSIKDKFAEFVEKETGKSSDGSRNSRDQQVLRNFRRAIYKGDVEEASRFYLRLLEFGYTSDRFAATIRAQDPLANENGSKALRRQFVESLDEFDREQLRRAYAYYTRMTGVRGAEKALFPSKASGERGLERYQANPRLDLLERQISRREQLTKDEELRRADYELRRSLKS